MIDFDSFLPLQEQVSDEFDLTPTSPEDSSANNQQNIPPQMPPRQKETDDEIVERETYSDAEKGNVNNIVVNIDDPCPVVILFGPKGSGKTMALVRLTRYLEKNGYTMEPYRLFRPGHDIHYKRICDSYKELCYDKYAPGGTETINFMLIKVLNKIGRPICQILEAPGEHYFDAKFPQQPFPTYIQQIITQIPNKKIWTFVVQKDWNPDTEKAPDGKEVDSTMIHSRYTQKVQEIMQTKRDKAIFLCHKIDMSRNTVLPNGKPNTAEFKRQVKLQYVNIFNNWMNRNPITKWFYPENFSFVPFSAGTFTEENGGRSVYIQGNDMYPRLLWQAIIKQIKG